MRFTNNLDAAVVGQQAPHARARRRFVVNH